MRHPKMTAVDLRELEADREVLELQADLLKSLCSGRRRELAPSAARRELAIRHELDDVKRRIKEARPRAKEANPRRESV